MVLYSFIYFQNIHKYLYYLFPFFLNSGIVAHSIIVLVQATTLNVAINSQNKALLTIMLSNNVSLLYFILFIYSFKFTSLLEITIPGFQNSSDSIL